MNEREWTLLELLNAARDYLSRKEIENARGDAEALLGKVIGLPRVQLYVQHDRPMRREEIVNYRTLLARRAQREPLQLLLGSVEFLDTVIQVVPGLLIPRPETEELAELAVKTARGFEKTYTLRILDIGTGTGCLAIALAKHIAGARVDAVDLDFEAVKCATANAERNGISDRVNVITADLFSPHFLSKVRPPYDIVTSNPPYVREDEFDSLPPEVKLYESRHTLTAGADGLNFYRRIADLISALMTSRGILLLEIGAAQGESVRRILSAAAHEVTVGKDLAGHDRFAIARLPKV